MEEVKTVRKRNSRKGLAVCPTCQSTMRVTFISKDVGGFTSLPGYAGWPKCLNIRKLIYQDVEEMTTQRIIKSTTPVNPQERNMPQ